MEVWIIAKTITVEIPEAGAKELQLEIKHLFAEITASQERMKRSKANIERSKARTRATLLEIEELLQRR